MKAHCVYDLQSLGCPVGLRGILCTLLKGIIICFGCSVNRIAYGIHKTKAHHVDLKFSKQHSLNHIEKMKTKRAKGFKQFFGPCLL